MVNMFKSLLMVVVTTLGVKVAADKCSELAKTVRYDQEILQQLEDSDSVTVSEFSADLDCLETLVRQNSFESAKFLLNKQFGGDNKDAVLLNKAQQTVQSAIRYVRKQQEDVMAIFENTQQMSSFSDNIPVIQPSIRWAQSANSTFVEVKFSTRFDSPACLDIFDDKITLDNSTLSISAMCRNDKKLLSYKLKIDLFEQVHPFEIDEVALRTYEVELVDYNEKYEAFQKENATYVEDIAVFEEKYQIWKKWNDSKAEKDKVYQGPDAEPSETAEAESLDAEEPENPIEPDEPEFDLEKPKPPVRSFYEMGSVGKIYFQFAKEQEARWKRLYKAEFGGKAKAQIWWEEYGKYEEELVKIDPYEDDDDKLLEKVADSKKPWLKSKSKNKKKKNKGKNKKSKSKSKEQKDEL